MPFLDVLFITSVNTILDYGDLYMPNSPIETLPFFLDMGMIYKVCSRKVKKSDFIYL